MHLQPKLNSSWYTARWTPLAWLEIVIKFGGITIGMIAGALTLANFAFIVPESIVRFFQLLILFGMALGLLAGIVDRYLDREIGAMFFVILNNLGHWGMVISMVAGNLGMPVLALFCFIMILGELVKLRFLRITNVKIRNIPSSFLYGLTGLYILGYSLIIALMFF